MQYFYFSIIYFSKKTKIFVDLIRNRIYYDAFSFLI